MCKASVTYCLWAFELFLFYFLPFSLELLPETVKVVFLTDQEIILGWFGAKSLHIYIDGKRSTSPEAILFPVVW